MVGEDKPKKPRTKLRTSEVRIDLGAAHNPTRLAHSGSRRRAARPVTPDERFLVRTEFVFADMKLHKDVKLCGDWCKWEPISMELEQGNFLCSCEVRALVSTPTEAPIQILPDAN